MMGTHPFLWIGIADPDIFPILHSLPDPLPIPIPIRSDRRSMIAILPITVYTIYIYYNNIYLLKSILYKIQIPEIKGPLNKLCMFTCYK